MGGSRQPPKDTTTGYGYYWGRLTIACRCRWCCVGHGHNRLWLPLAGGFPSPAGWGGIHWRDCRFFFVPFPRNTRFPAPFPGGSGCWRCFASDKLKVILMCACRRIAFQMNDEIVLVFQLGDFFAFLVQ